MIRRALILLCALLPLSGCAALRPIEPDSASVAVSWYSRHRHWRFSMSDGYLLPSGWLPGPHEVFAASLRYTFWRRK